MEEGPALAEAGHMRSTSGRMLSVQQQRCRKRSLLRRQIFLLQRWIRTPPVPHMPSGLVVVHLSRSLPFVELDGVVRC